MNNFDSLGLEPRLLKALAHEGYETPTPIQTQAIPHILAGKDLLGIAQTGTGKTAGFALPILQRLALDKRTAAPKTARTLVLSPTRELSAQIADSFKAYGRYMNMNVTTVFGGVSEYAQKQIMSKGIDILVATPGRLLDLVNQRAVDLSKTEIFVLDEADRMLDMGFINDIRKLVARLPRERQNLFFSATMPQEIGALADDLLKNPISVTVTPQATTVEKIAQRVIHVDNGSKRALLVDLLRTDKAMERTLVFTRTKHGADKVVRALDAAAIVSSAIHGNKSQSQRVSTLNAFRAGRTRVLIATDIAARGIDVDGITHVINFDLPHVAEAYVHRIGRTARAGAEGIAIAFCDREERGLLRDIERLTRQQIPSSEWKARPPQPGDIVEVMERPRPERRDEPRRDQRAHAPRRDDRPRGPRNDDRRPAQPHTAKPHAERATHAPRPHGDHAPRPHSAKPHGERAAHAPRPHGDHAPRPHGAKPHGKPHGAKPHGAKPHGERTAHTGDGPRPFNKGPKPHRKDPKPAHAGAPIRDAGGNALPRFLQRSAPRA
ncbi:MAG: DEAD/DEAH box helicase [Micropepsaceae bacterium]